MKHLFATFFLASAVALAQSESVLKEGNSFFQWLEKNESSFVNCKIGKKGDQVTMCDGTEVSFLELKKLFAKSANELLVAVKEKGVAVNIICSLDQKPSEFGAVECSPESSDKTFKRVSALHGLYVAETNSIFIRSSASRGTLIHEYLHFLQSKNNQKIYGHMYKTEKNQLKQKINQALDQIEIDLKTAEKNKEPALLKQKTAEFMKVNDLMLAFSKWQDLIDERSLFLLFVKFENDFKIPKDDLDLALKNLGFICNRKDYNSPLPECESL